MRIRAPAKVNPYLRVAGRRDDGYHEIESVFQAVSLFDDLELRPSDNRRVQFTWGPGLDGELPEPPDLIEKVLSKLHEAQEVRPVEVLVTKRIPISAGLGGGSSNAASALLGIQNLFRDELEVSEVAAEVGADVPFFLRGGTALGTGRGDELTRLECGSTLWWVLGISNDRLSTADVYANYDRKERPFGPLVSELVKALSVGDPEEIARLLYNDLETPATDLLPSITHSLEAMRSSGALGTVLCGSGPTVAGLSRDESHARSISEKARSRFPRVEVVHSLTGGPELISAWG